MIGTIIFAILGGIVIGALGKWLAPGNRDKVPFWLTIVCGIGGIFIGTWLYGQFFHVSNHGIDWWRHVWQVVVAAVLVTIASTVTGGRTRRRGLLR